MNRNIIASALDRVDAEPTDEFLDDLRVRLLAGLAANSGRSESATSTAVARSTPEPVDGYVSLAANLATSPPPPGNAKRRLIRVALAVAASLAILATAAVVATRGGDDQHSTGELNDVDAQEALPLARSAFISADALGQTYHEMVLLPESVENNLAAQTRVSMPECAILPSFGLMQPSSKAVAPSQFFAALGGIAHTVHVFATAQDASRAMDVIEGDVYPACRLDLFDRMIPLEGVYQTASSEPWDAPTIPTHGDRQIAFGQHTTFTGGSAPSEAFYVNVYVQVGRAISWMNPQLLSTDNPLFQINKAADAQTAALESVFGH